MGPTRKENMDQDRVAKFKQVISNITGRTVFLIAQVDPDALSAFALAYILRTLGKINIEIYYAGSIGHPQNRSIVNRFGLAKKMKLMKDLKLEETDTLILVDSSSLDDSRLPELREIFLKKQPTIVVDHHRGDNIPETPENFIWVEEVGAASTLVVELLQALEIKIPEDDKFVSILLAMGIYTDTKALITGHRRDVEAYGDITKDLGYDDIAPLINYPLSDSYFVNLRNALANMVLKETRLVTGLGFIEPQSGDDISSIADHLIRRSGVSLVVVWGIIGNIVRISARTKDVSVSLEDFLRSRFPGSGAKLAPDGHGEGGATISLNGLDVWISDGSRPIIEQLIAKRLEEIIFSN